MTWQLWSTSGSSFWSFFVTVSCVSLFYLINLVTRFLEINISFSHIISCRSSQFTIRLYGYILHFTITLNTLHFTFYDYTLPLHFTFYDYTLRLHFPFYDYTLHFTMSTPTTNPKIEFADNEKTY